MNKQLIISASTMVRAGWTKQIKVVERIDTTTTHVSASFYSIWTKGLRSLASFAPDKLLVDVKSASNLDEFKELGLLDLKHRWN